MNMEFFFIKGKVGLSAWIMKIFLISQIAFY